MLHKKKQKNFSEKKRIYLETCISSTYKQQKNVEHHKPQSATTPNLKKKKKSSKLWQLHWQQQNQFSADWKGN